MNAPWFRSGDWLLHSAVGGGLLLLLACLLMVYCRQPARRQSVGEWGAAAALLVAALSLGPPWLHVPLLPPETTPEVATLSVAPAPVFPEDEAYPDGEDTALAADGTTRYWVEVSSAESADAGPVAEAPFAVTGTVADRPASWFAALPLARLWSALAAAYAVAAAVLAARWLLGYFALWRLLRKARPAPARVARLFQEMVGGPRPPRLLISDRIRVPLSCSLLRPTVVVPPALCGPGAAATLRWVFAHELTHLRRRDAWACLLFGLAQAVYFYVPWFWWLRRQVRLCQEYIADAAAVEEAEAPEDYAEFLLTLTSAPAVPLSATGVLGHSSDLFRRVTMLLQNPLRVEKRCPRWWSVAAAGGLIALGVFASGLSLRAHAAPRPDADLFLNVAAEEPQADDDKPQPKKERPAKPRGDEPKVAFPDVEELLKRLPADTDPEKLKHLRDELSRARDQMKKAMEEIERARPQIEDAKKRAVEASQNAYRQAMQHVLTSRRAGQTGEMRLGVAVERPSSVLADQLDLPRNQGLIVVEVQPDSPAAKAGLKANDILLEVNGKPVSNDHADLVKMLGEIKADQSVSIVVLRKGKKETIKGVSLPEAKESKRRTFVIEGAERPGAANRLWTEVGPGPFVAGGRGVMTSVFRTDDHFTTRHQEGSLIITLTGKVADGKARVSEIHVQDGRTNNKYDSLDKVPDQYRDKVKNLVDMSEKGNTKIDIKSSREDRRPENKRVPPQGGVDLKGIEAKPRVHLNVDPKLLHQFKLEVKPENLKELKELKEFTIELKPQELKEFKLEFKPEELKEFKFEFKPEDLKDFKFNLDPEQLRRNVKPLVPKTLQWIRDKLEDKPKQATARSDKDPI